MITIYYDGNCTFCNYCRRFAEIHSQPGAMTFVDLNSQEAVAALGNDSRHLVRPFRSIVVHTETNNELTKWQATMMIAKQMKQPWRLLGYLGQVVPSFIGDTIYDWVTYSRRFF
ncbi:MAG: DCC1-like thiol-disulfide oxidoreductase family protein [Patescibacteria group bacterium]